MFQLVQQHARLVREVAADGGEADATRGPLEQADAKRVLQLRHAPAQRGLRQVYRVGGGAEIHQLRHRDKCLQVGKIEAHVGNRDGRVNGRPNGRLGVPILIHEPHASKRLMRATPL